MEYFIQQLVNGITLGSIYGLIAIGYTMVYGIIGMINFAHGDIFIDLVDSAVEEESQVFGSRSKQLFNQINRCLKDDGVIVCQASPYQKEVLNTFKKHFKKSYGWTDNFDLDSANSFVYAIK